MTIDEPDRNLLEHALDWAGTLDGGLRRFTVVATHVTEIPRGRRAVQRLSAPARTQVQRLQRRIDDVHALARGEALFATARLGHRERLGRALYVLGLGVERIVILWNGCRPGEVVPAIAEVLVVVAIPAPEQCLRADGAVGIAGVCPGLFHSLTFVVIHRRAHED